jgi:pyruvate kinase
MSRRAKIVGTIGPSSSTVEKLEQLITAGLNVARVNMSHGTHEGHTQTIENIRQASKNMKTEVGILCDLQGPKIRVDKLPEPLELKEGETWVIGPSHVQNDYPEYKNCFIPTIYKDLVNDAHEGAIILFDDGLLEAHATEKDRDVLKIEVKVGGLLKSNKGINLPNVNVSAPSLTEKDEEDLMFGLKSKVDFVALSFVRTAEDIRKVKYIMHKLKVNIPIVAKIEKPEAVENIEEIVEVTDCIMIARGDMGVEVGNHLVPSIQKQIISLCNSRGVPVITATQMLESMTTNARPTRAEANDVANAIWDGTDAVMLSGETASGKFPIEAVKMMGSIIEEAEKSPKERPLLRHTPLTNVTSSIQVAASVIAEKAHAKWIVCVTQSGNSALHMSRFRTNVGVLGVTNSAAVMRKMCLYWGITPYYFQEDEEDLSTLQEQMIQQMKDQKMVHNGDKLVITHGDGKFFRQGTSNSIRVEIIKDVPKEDHISAGQEVVLEEKIDGGKILLDTAICASCQSCIHVCPHDIWTISEDDNKETIIDSNRANECTKDMECVRVCPTGAIEIINTSL